MKITYFFALLLIPAMSWGQTNIYKRQAAAINGKALPIESDWVPALCHYDPDHSDQAFDCHQEIQRYAWILSEWMKKHTIKDTLSPPRTAHALATIQHQVNALQNRVDSLTAALRENPFNNLRLGPPDTARIRLFQMEDSMPQESLKTYMGNGDPYLITATVDTTKWMRRPAKPVKKKP